MQRLRGPFLCSLLQMWPPTPTPGTSPAPPSEGHLPSRSRAQLGFPGSPVSIRGSSRSEHRAPLPLVKPLDRQPGSGAGGAGGWCPGWAPGVCEVGRSPRVLEGPRDRIRPLWAPSGPHPDFDCWGSGFLSMSPVVVFPGVQGTRAPLCLGHTASPDEPGEEASPPRCSDDTSCCC